MRVKPAGRPDSGESAGSLGVPADVLVVSGRYPATTFESAANHRAYCGEHGYTYVHCNWPTGQPVPYLNKIEYVLHLFDRFEWVFWIDDDAFFLDPTRSLDHLAPPAGKFMSVCASPTYKQLFTPISSGQFLIRTSDVARRFLATVRDTDLDVVRSWWTDDLGFFTGGDQDAMVYAMSTMPEFGAGIEVFDYSAFNSRIDDIAAGRRVFLIHFTGEQWIKRRDWKRAARLTGRGPELLPGDLAQRYRVRRRRPWPIRQGGELYRRLNRLVRRLRSARN